MFIATSPYSPNDNPFLPSYIRPNHGEIYNGLHPSCVVVLMFVYLNDKKQGVENSWVSLENKMAREWVWASKKHIYHYRSNCVVMLK